MRLIAGGAQRGPAISAAALTGSLAVLCLTVFVDIPTGQISAVVALVAIGAIATRSLLQWRSLLALMILVILFVPIKRYTLPGNLPFDLEPYRILVALVIAAWLGSLLVDPRVRARRSGLEGPILLIVFTALASDIVNPSRVSNVQSEVWKGLMFLASYFLVFYLIVSVIRTHQQLDSLIKILVGGAGVVAICAMIESRTHFNVFDHVASSIPVLKPSDQIGADIRGGELRAFASAQGPIPLGAALAMLLPLGIYLGVRSRGWKWWLVAAALGLGALATVSRTSVLMIAVAGLVFLWLRPAQTKRLWPALLPAMAAVYFLLPGTIGTLRSSFFPAGGLIAEQSAHAGWRGSGRVADLHPALRELTQHPLLGEGFGTRQPGREIHNAAILDDQWLKTLLETGVLGILAWIWLFVRFIRRHGRAAKEDLSDRGWLSTALTASLASFAAGMLFYDTFSFVQVTFLAFIVLGFGAALMAARTERGTPRSA